MVYKTFFIILVTMSLNVCALDVRDYETGDIELFRKHFDLNTTFIEDKYLELRIKAEPLKEFSDNECELDVTIQYDPKNEGSVITKFRNLNVKQLSEQSVHIAGIKGDATLVYKYSSYKDKCKKEKEYVRRYGFYFKLKDILPHLKPPIPLSECDRLGDDCEKRINECYKNPKSKGCFGNT